MYDGKPDMKATVLNDYWWVFLSVMMLQSRIVHVRIHTYASNCMVARVT